MVVAGILLLGAGVGGEVAHHIWRLQNDFEPLNGEYAPFWWERSRLVNGLMISGCLSLMIGVSLHRFGS